jgi:hypothetical protein
MEGYRGPVVFNDLEVAAMASLPDELLGKIVSAATRGGVNALHDPLYAMRTVVVRIRTGNLLSGILLLDSNPNSDAQQDALEVIAAAYDLWVSAGQDPATDTGYIFNTKQEELEEQLRLLETRPGYWLGGVTAGVDPMTRGLAEASTLNAAALNAYRVQDSKNIALAIGVLAISLGKTLLRKDKTGKPVTFFVKAIIKTISEYLATGGYENLTLNK